jgi:CxxC-x17-CxxC domain-containing protein
MAPKKFGGKRFSREMHKGHWTCTGCGTEITELPFEPSLDRPVYCRECWAKKRVERGK